MTTAAAHDRAAEEREEVTRPHYHPIGITFHWLMAVMVFAQLLWGWRTSLMAPGYDKLEAYGIHSLIGIGILLLAFLRASWRAIAPFVLPDLEKPEDLPGWQRFAAEATHIALYVLMFALPLSGWLMLTAAATGDSISLAWGWSWPLLPFVEELDFVERAHLEQTAERTHFALVWLMMGLVAVHVGAALKHHFIDRDDVLARMIPMLSRDRPRA